MMRTFSGSLVVFALTVGFLLAAEKDTKENKGKTEKATITKVDKKAGTITVKMKNSEGKEVEKTFKLFEDIRYFDSTGKAAVIDVFQSGNDVLVVEEEGRLKEIHQGKSLKTPPPEKKPEGK